jgi:flagellar biosynthesis/type III secretory pathway protein FliH
MRSHALASARRTVDYVRILEKEKRRLERKVEALTGEALAAKTAAAALRDELNEQANLAYNAGHQQGYDAGYKAGYDDAPRGDA